MQIRIEYKRNDLDNRLFQASTTDTPGKVFHCEISSISWQDARDKLVEAVRRMNQQQPAPPPEMVEL